MRPFGKTLRVWSDQHFVVILHNCGPADNGRVWIGYKFYDYAFDPVNPLIFCGDDYQVAAGTDPSSYSAVFGLLHFMSLKPGDVDKDYFSSYDDRQIRWRDSQRSDDLAMLVMDFGDDHG